MLNEKELKAYANLMSSRLLKDPGVLVQIGALERAKLLFALSCEGQIKAFDQQNTVHVLGNAQGLLIGYSSNLLPEEQLLEVLKQASAKLMEVASEDELLFIQNRALEVNKITAHDWYKNYYAGEIYHLFVVAIDNSLKGTGALRNLLMPVIKQCEEKKIPIILQTHNPDNVPIYQHYGFKLIESHFSEEINLFCFCMARG
ncbi:MAG: GNAT family N-acetyltransferase [Clostridia bacterium]|nr:GNAT family N-acetyltransferase [Clostridia bacterium]